MALKQLNDFTSKVEIVSCLKISDSKYIYSISRCDALFFIDGGYFNKYWGNKMIITFVLPIVLGCKLRKPIYISGVNLGPFDDLQINKLYGLFNNIDTLILRDVKSSIKTLKN